MCIVIWVPDADPALSGVLPPMNMNFLEHFYINRAACFARSPAAAGPGAGGGVPPHLSIFLAPSSGFGISCDTYAI